MVKLGPNRYGKAEVRLVRVTRAGQHAIKDWNVSVSLAGDLTAVHLSGSNESVLPTDTQKNTVYALAQQLGHVEPEQFGLSLARHFRTREVPISTARVSIEEYGWDRLGDHSFARSGGAVRTASVIEDAEHGRSVLGGINNLVLLNTTDSEFAGFATDEYTTLAETHDRILATEVQASWRFRDAVADVDWATAFQHARQALVDGFVDTYSYSLQQTLYAMGSAVLNAVPQICEVRLALPNKHHFLVDLAPFGLPNDNEVYFAADRPYGLIEGHVLADDARPAGLAWT
jgi:urate oxidase